MFTNTDWYFNETVLGLNRDNSLIDLDGSFFNESLDNGDLNIKEKNLPNNPNYVYRKNEQQYSNYIGSTGVSSFPINELNDTRIYNNISKLEKENSVNEQKVKILAGNLSETCQQNQSHFGDNEQYGSFIATEKDDAVTVTEKDCQDENHSKLLGRRKKTFKGPKAVHSELSEDNQYNKITAYNFQLIFKNVREINENNNLNYIFKDITYKNKRKYYGIKKLPIFFNESIEHFICGYLDESQCYENISQIDKMKEKNDYWFFKDLFQTKMKDFYENITIENIKKNSKLNKISGLLSTAESILNKYQIQCKKNH